MISKKLTIAAAFVLLTGLSVGPAQAQATAPAPTAPAATSASSHPGSGKASVFRSATSGAATCAGVAMALGGA